MPASERGRVNTLSMALAGGLAGAEFLAGEVFAGLVLVVAFMLILAAPLIRAADARQLSFAAGAMTTVAALACVAGISVWPRLGTDQTAGPVTRPPPTTTGTPLPGATTSAASPAPSGTVIRLQAERLLPPLFADAPVRSQPDCCGVRWNGGAQLFFTPSRPDSSVRVRFTVPLSGTYELVVVQTQAPDYGINTLAIDDQMIGHAFDAYHRPAVVIAAPRSYGRLTLIAGQHTLTLTVTDRNDASSAYFAGLDYLDLRPSGG